MADPGAAAPRPRSRPTGRGLALALRLVLVLTACAIAGALSSADAKPCGGATPCECGDAVTSDYALSHDLGPCPAHGLLLKSKAKLDCQGRRIVGMGNGSEQFGVFLDGKPGAEVAGATVKDCNVTRFLRGIRLRSANSNLIVGNTASGNGDFKTHVGYGIDVSGASSNNVFENNRVQGNADEGIHIGYRSRSNRLVGNVVSDNFRENLYLLGADRGVFQRNTFGGGGVNSLYLKDSSFNRFEGNTFNGKTVRVIGGSQSNQFIDNTLAGAGMHFAPFRAQPPRVPTKNRVTGGSITGAPECLRFTGSGGNMVTDVAFGECRVAVRMEAGQEPLENTVIGAVPAALTIDEGTTLNLGWKVTVEVDDADGAPIPGAQVEAKDNTGQVLFTAVTDHAGITPAQVVIATTRTGPASVRLSPLKITVTKAGFATRTRTVSVTDHTRVTIQLAKS